MRSRWRAYGALLASTLLGSWWLLAPVAAAQPIGQPVPPAAGGPELLRLKVTEMGPRIVTAATGAITITGKITNVGDRRVDDVRVRVQRGAAMTTDRAMREVTGQATDVAIGPFQNVVKSLDRGDSADVKITVPVRGDGGLAIDDPGVYPVLVNVNARPDYGQQARLAAVSVPVPVLSTPSTPEPAPKASPPGITMLWPILDTEPHRLPTTNGTTLLANDDLANSLTVGGRLFDLVNSVRAAANTDSSLLGAMCFVVDPDLLDTVAKMTDGYQVRSGDQSVPGKGGQAAEDWLKRLQELSRGQCVISVPYGDADLVALSRAGAVDLAQQAIAGSSIVSELLSPVEPQKNLYWPAGGTFDQRTLVDLANVGPATVLADPAHLERVEGNAPYTINGTQTPNPVRAVPIDSLVSDALAGRGERDAAIDVDSTQNGMAALIYRSMFDERAGGEVLIAPPRRWEASGAELTQFLSLAKQMFDGGFATPRSLEALTSAPANGTAASLAYTTQDGAQEIPTQVTAEVMRINATKRDLLAAMVDDNTNAVEPTALLQPIQDGLLRSVSTAYRGRATGAQRAVDEADAQLDGLREAVVVKDPGRPLSLASGDSPILVTIYNGLPVTIVVHINLSSTPGLSAGTYPDVQVPPRSSAPRYIPAEVSRSGRLSVDATLTTPTGTPLGNEVRLELNSTSYGIISVAVTGTAGAVLVLLVGVRIFRRVKAARKSEPSASASEEIIDS